MTQTRTLNEQAHALADQWSSYAAYLLSFVVIGIMWVNHHALIATVARTDRVLLLLNLLLLLWIAFLPFPTGLVADFIRKGDDAHVAMAVYSGTMFGCAIAFNLMSDRVDFRVPELHYTSPAETLAFCQRELSRHVRLRHDYPLHEYTVHVRREAMR